MQIKLSIFEWYSNGGAYTILSDLHGKVIQQKEMENKFTSVSFQALANASYFIQEVNNYLKYKPFK